MELLNSIITVTDLQRQTGKFIKQAKAAPLIITQRGRPAAILVDAEMYMAMVERLRELEDKEMVEMVAQAEAEFAAGKEIPHVEAVARMRAAWEKQTP
jgi:prevent-host-death family protein